MLAHQGAHDGARDDVADAAAQGNVATESAGSQDDAIRLSGERFGHSLDIAGMVLAVGIRGDDSLQIRETRTTHR